MTISQSPLGFPDTKETIDSFQDASKPSLISSKSIRQFRDINLINGTRATIRSVRTNELVPITIKKLNNHQKYILSTVCDFIESKLIGTSYEEPIKNIMKVTGFIVTSSKHVGAYCQEVDGAPIVIFNSKIIGTDNEFAVTVLHELLHFLNVSDDRDNTSFEEAKHDIACYGFLGIPISTDHWAFIKYPELLELVKSEIEKNKGEQK